METIQTTKIDETNINYNVYNALNLMNENLGECYLQDGFNPFDEGFELSEEFVLKRYNNSRVKNELISPDFINQGTKQTKKSFEKSIENIDAVILELDNLLSDYTLDERTKAKYENIRFYLMCRRQLTLLFISKLKTDRNTLKMYQELISLDWELEECCKDIFNEFFDIQIAINAFKEFAKGISAEDKKLIQRAKDIIKQNLQNQAAMQSKQQSKTNLAATIKAPTFAKKETIDISKNIETKQPSASKEVISKSANTINPEQERDSMVLKYQEFIKNRDGATETKTDEVVEPTATTASTISTENPTKNKDDGSVER